MSPASTPQQRRFAGAVRPDQRDRLARRDRERDRVEQRLARRRAPRATCVSTTAVIARSSERWRSSIARKNGAPTSAVRMPIGTSAGAAMVRAQVSAASSRMAPRQTEAGSSRRWPGPITSRNRCGTTMPTKPITPANGDGRPGHRRHQHDRDAASAARPRRPCGTPRPRPAPAGRARARSTGMATSMATPGTAPGSRALVQVAPLSEPSSQNVMSRNCRSSAMKTSSRCRHWRARRSQARPAGRSRSRCGSRASRCDRGWWSSPASRRRRRAAGLRTACWRPAGQHAVADHDGRRGGKRAAARNADQRRIGERVAKQPLHDGAARRQQRADHARRSRSAAAGSTTAPADRGRALPDRRRRPQGRARPAGGPAECRRRRSSRRRSRPRAAISRSKTMTVPARSARPPMPRRCRPRRCSDGHCRASRRRARPSRSDGSGSASGRDRARSRDRAPRARCAARSRADRVPPWRRTPALPPPASRERRMREHGRRPSSDACRRAPSPAPRRAWRR